MKNKFLSCIAVVVIMSIAFSSIISAEGSSSPFVSGAVPRTEEQYISWLMKHDRSMKESYLPPDNSTYTTWVRVSNLTYMPQESYNTCAVACIRMALNSINGSCDNESTVLAEIRDLNLFTYDEYGNGVGMTAEQVMEYLNLKQTVNYYIEERKQTEYNLQSDIYSVISGKDAPAIVGVLESADDFWPFENVTNLGPHWVIAYGTTNYMDQFYIADPYAGYSGATLYNQYSVTLDTLYAGYSALDIGYLW